MSGLEFEISILADHRGKKIAKIWTAHMRWLGRAAILPAASSPGHHADVRMMGLPVRLGGAGVAVPQMALRSRQRPLSLRTGRSWSRGRPMHPAGDANRRSMRIML